MNANRMILPVSSQTRAGGRRRAALWALNSTNFAYPSKQAEAFLDGIAVKTFREGTD